MVFDMKTRTMLYVCSAALILTGIFLAGRVLGPDWAIGLLVAGMIAFILVHGFILGVAERDASIVAVALFVFGCICFALNGGVAEIILDALGGRVTLSMATAATLTGVGGVLLGIVSVQK